MSLKEVGPNDGMSDIVDHVKQAEIERDRALPYACQVVNGNHALMAWQCEIEDAFLRLNARALAAGMVIVQPMVVPLHAGGAVAIVAQWFRREDIEKIQREQKFGIAGAMPPRGKGPTHA